MIESKTVSDLVQAVMKAWEKWIIKEQLSPPRLEPPKTIWASQFTTCARAMTLHLQHGHEVARNWDADTLAKFRRGNDRERDIKSDMEHIGRECDPPFDLVGQQEGFQVKDRKGRNIISGRVDARIKFLGNGYGLGFPLEIKDWHPNLTSNVISFEDLFKGRWTRKGAYQMLLYLYATSQPLGFMLLSRPGLPKLLPVELWSNDNSNRIDQFLDTAETAVDHLEAGTLPDYVQDLTECKMCNYCGSFCQPPRLSGEGAQIIVDQELANAINERAQLKSAADRYGRVDEEIKSKLRGVEFGLCDKWVIEGKWGKSTKTVFPDEETKRLYQITDPKGKFSLTFHKVGEANDGD